MLGLIGPNGSGKTTVLNMISGALRADRGTIALAGADDRMLPAHRIARAASRARSSSCACCPTELPGERRRRLAFRRDAGLGRRGRGPRAAPAGARRPRRQDGHAGGAAHLHRPEARRARPRAGARPDRAAARRMARRPQSDRAAGRHRADRDAARRRPHHRHRRACDGCDPLALRPLRRDERRPQDRRRHARRRAGRPRR